MDLLPYVYNHMVLPPQVPGQEDPDPVAVSCNVLQRLASACEAVKNIIGLPWNEAFHTLHSSLRVCLLLNKGRLDRKWMLHYFGKLEIGQMLILHVAEQNAALIIRRQCR